MKKFNYIFILISLLAISLSSYANLQVFRKLDNLLPPADISVSPGGRVFMSTHLAYGGKHRMVELLPDDQFEPYPEFDFHPKINAVLGTVVDEHNILWFLDTIWGKDAIGRVIGWSIEKNQLHKIFYIARPIVNNAYILNDLAVDRKNNAIYITETADANTSALLVVNLKTGLVRRVLDGSLATTPENKDIVIDNEVLYMQGKPARIGVNPITIDINYEWLYFAPMSSNKLYRISTKALNDESLTPPALEKQIEFYANKPMSDGITIDANNNIYISDLQNHAIGIVNANREYSTLYQNNNTLSWVAGFAAAGNLGILAVSNKAHNSPAFNNKKPTPNEFYIMQFPALAEAVTGR